MKFNSESLIRNINTCIKQYYEEILEQESDPVVSINLLYREVKQDNPELAAYVKKLLYDMDLKRKSEEKHIDFEPVKIPDFEKGEPNELTMIGNRIFIDEKELRLVESYNVASQGEDLKTKLATLTLKMCVDVDSISGNHKHLPGKDAY